MLVRRRLLLVALLCSLVLAGCSSSSSESAGPSATVQRRRPTTTTSTTTALTPEQEVEAAYLRSWDVYAKAVRNLDPSGLEESYADPQLAKTVRAVAELKQRGNAIKVSVTHNYAVRILEPDRAIVRDRYRNHSVLIDPESGIPKEPDPNDEYLENYTLRKVGGRWRVVDIARDELPS